MFIGYELMHNTNFFLSVLQQHNMPIAASSQQNRLDMNTLNTWWTLFNENKKLADENIVERLYQAYLQHVEFSGRPIKKQIVNLIEPMTKYTLTNHLAIKFANIDSLIVFSDPRDKLNQSLIQRSD